MFHHVWLGKDHFPWPVGGVLPCAAQETVGVICHEGALLAHIQPVHWEPQVLFCKATFQSVSWWCVLLHGIVLLQGQDFAFPTVEHQDRIPAGPFLLLVKVSLDVSTAIWCINHSSWLCTSRKLAVVYFVPSSRSSVKIGSSICLGTSCWGRQLTKGLLLDFALLFYNPLRLAVQHVLNPPHCLFNL